MVYNCKIMGCPDLLETTDKLVEELSRNGDYPIQAERVVSKRCVGAISEGSFRRRMRCPFTVYCRAGFGWEGFKKEEVETWYVADYGKLCLREYIKSRKY
jgi:hypothetical protein